ncbi:MAG: hypothetical protein ACK56F_18325, partial [bacterium]
MGLAGSMEAHQDGQPDQEPPGTSPSLQVPLLPAADVARKIRDVTLARGYQMKTHMINRNVRLNPRRTRGGEAELFPISPASPQFFAPANLFARTRKVRAVAGQEDEAKARAERLQLLTA